MVKAGIKQIFIIMLVGCSSTSFALQTQWVKDNGTVHAKIAEQALTKIAVENDRILNVKGPQGFYEIDVKSDTRHGAVFIQPLPMRPKNNFTLFITTEKGGHYMLALTPNTQMADTILLKVKGGHRDAASLWEKNTPYLTLLSDLIQDMMTGKSPEGYGIQFVSGKAHAFNKNLTLQQEAVYEGAHVAGLIYRIHNRLNQSLTLLESEFYQEGDRAIALQSRVIGPRATTLLFKVVSHD